MEGISMREKDSGRFRKNNRRYCNIHAFIKKVVFLSLWSVKGDQNVLKDFMTTFVSHP
jgi:hypothetical protein